MTQSFASLSYRRAALEGAYDVIVIGSGVGGLAAAALLAKYGGRRVLVLERHYTAGGFTHVFKRPGFEWDVGLHYIGQIRDPDSEARRIFDHLTDGKLQWASMPDVYDRIIVRDQTFDFPSGIERFRERMKSYFPEDGRAIDRYIHSVNRCVAATKFFFAEKLVPPLLSKIIGRALRRPYLRYANKTTADVFREFTRNPELVAVLTAQWPDYGLPPAQSSFGVHAIVAKHYFEGGGYPVGGAGAILASMGPIIERAGGCVVVNAEVDSVLVESGRVTGVRMADGNEIHATVVISDAGAVNTYNRLLRVNSPGVDDMRHEIAGIPPSAGHLCLYVGLEGSSSELKLQGTNLWIYPSTDHDANVRHFFADPESEFAAVYMSFPSAKDPSFEHRFPGHSTIEVITFVPYTWFSAWEKTPWHKRGPDYERLKQKFESRLLEILYRYVPSAKGRVIHTELSTPVTTRHFVNYGHGEAYGLAHTPERFRMRSLGPRTPIQGLFLTGQDIATVGVTGAAAGGILAASAVLRRNLFALLAERFDRLSRDLKLPAA